MKTLFAVFALAPLMAFAASPEQEIGTTYGQPQNAPARPLWEVGVGAVGAYAADYPAAAHSHFNSLPIPYVIYRGDFLRVGDGGGVRGVFLDNQQWEFDLSANASFDAESDGNTARSGMPDLDFLAELGPQLKYKLISTPLQSLEVRLPVRAVFSIGDDLEVNNQGYTFAPRLALRQSGLAADYLPEPLTFFASVGPTFGSENLQRYFYEVAPQFSNANRPAYRAEGGYLGSEVTAGFSTSLTPRLRAFAGGNVGYYGGAANADSPLHKRDVNAGVALGFAWSFYQSEAKTGR